MDLHWGSDTVLLIIIAVLGWFMKSTMNKNDAKHDKHFEHSADTSLHESDRERNLARESVHRELAAHDVLDNERFANLDHEVGAISQRQLIIQADVKEILKIVARK